MSAVHAGTNVGLGRPSSLPDEARPQTLTTSLSLSASSTSSLSSPMALARSQYSSAAHHFIQRRPQQALTELEEARRLALQVISPGDELRKHANWQSLREKVVILWITLLVSFAKGEQRLPDERQMQSDTRGILDAARDPAAFLRLLVSAVLAAWQQSVGVDGEENRQTLLARIPASVTASLLMAGLSIEEAATAARSTVGSSAASKQSQEAEPSPTAVPLTRELAEEFLSAQSAHLDSASDADGANDASASLLAANARVLELYAIHILGVRCGQWDYADQLVRLSLLPDEPRAKLLSALQKAHHHISTRPQRRASAALAQQKAYEAEKQRRASASASASTSGSGNEANGRGQDSEQDTSTTNGKRNGKRSTRRGSGSTTVAPSLRRTTSSSSSSSSTAASESEAEGGAAGRSAAKHASSDARDFAAARSHVSSTIARHHQRDGVGANATNASSSSRSTATNTRPQSTLTMLKTYLRTMKLKQSLPVLISVLAPLLVIIFSIKRLMAGRAATGGRKRVAGAGAAAAKTEAEQSLLRRAVASVWGTLRMGTQVTYL